MSTNAVAPDDGPDPLTSRVAEEVRALMARKRVTQKDLVPVLGVTQGQVSGRLRGRLTFTVNELGMLGNYFGVSPAALLGAGNAERPRPIEAVEGVSYGIRDSNPEPAD